MALVVPRPIASWTVAVAAALILAVAGACSRPGPAADGVTVAMRVRPEPPVVGVVEVEILLADAAGDPVPATAVELEGNMAHAGMRPSFATARPEGAGRWLADLELTMAGDWFVVVDARLANGDEIERTLPLPGVEPR